MIHCKIMVQKKKSEKTLKENTYLKYIMKDQSIGLILILIGLKKFTYKKTLVLQEAVSKQYLGSI